LGFFARSWGCQKSRPTIGEHRFLVGFSIIVFNSQSLTIKTLLITIQFWVFPTAHQLQPKIGGFWMTPVDWIRSFDRILLEVYPR